MSSLEKLTRVAAALPPEAQEALLNVATIMANLPQTPSSAAPISDQEFAARLEAAEEIPVDSETAALLDQSIAAASSWRSIDELRAEPRP